MAEEIITLPQEEIALDEKNNILRAVVLPDAELTLEDARLAIAACKKLSNGQRLPILVDITHIRSINREARLYYGGEEAGVALSAVAFVTTSLIGKIVGNFLVGLNRMDFPAKIFSSEEKAIKWLAELSK